jgi:thiol-disulfide isomerase/thioredoxin
MRIMPAGLVVILAAIALACGAGPRPAAAGDGPGTVLGRALADGTLHTLEGDTPPAPGSGGILVVNFWATWCKPCKQEMPLLDRLHRRLRETGGAVVAVSVDRNPDRVAEFVKDLELALPVCVDGPEGLAEALDLEYLPYTYVLDGSGHIIHQGAGGEGENWTAVIETVDRLLAGGTEPAGGTRGME